jgi:hypothetical protein
VLYQLSYTRNYELIYRQVRDVQPPSDTKIAIGSALPNLKSQIRNRPPAAGYPCPIWTAGGRGSPPNWAVARDPTSHTPARISTTPTHWTGLSRS